MRGDRWMTLAWLVVAGCGRLGFGASSNDRVDAPPVSPPDGQLARRDPCNVGGVASNPLTVSGTTMHYSDYEGHFAPIATVNVTLSGAGDTLGPTVATSAGDGSYKVELTDGKSHALRLDLVAPGYLVTHQYTAGLLDAPLRDYLSPLWDATAMGNIYRDGGAGMPSSEKGNVFVQIERCDGTPVDGVEVQISPSSPNKVVYLGETSTQPDPAMTATGKTHASAIGYNLTPGRTQIIAVKDGLTFNPIDLDIAKNENNVVVMRPYDEP